MLSLKSLLMIALMLGVGTTGLVTVSLNPSAAAQVGSTLNAVSTNLGLRVGAHAGAQTQAQIGKNTVNANARAQTQTQATVNTQKQASPQHPSNANASTQTSVNATVNTTTTTSANSNENADNSLKVATDIANEFGVAVSDVTALRNSGWGYGEIVKLYEMAKQSGKSVADIEAMRASGKGWGEIAALLNTSVSGPGINLGAIISGRGTLKPGHK